MIKQFQALVVYIIRRVLLHFFQNFISFFNYWVNCDQYWVTCDYYWAAYENYFVACENYLTSTSRQLKPRKPCAAAMQCAYFFKVSVIYVCD